LSKCIKANVEIFFQYQFFSIRLVLMTIFFCYLVWWSKIRWPNWFVTPKIFNFFIDSNSISTLDPTTKFGWQIIFGQIDFGDQMFLVVVQIYIFGCHLKNVFIHHSKMVSCSINSGSISHLMIKFWLVLFAIGLWW
jgi:hypothetical protein